MPENMRILIIAMSESIHTARWISQVSDQGWEIHLYPSVDYGLTHPMLQNIHIHHSYYDEISAGEQGVKVHGMPVFFKPLSAIGRKGHAYYSPDFRVRHLAKLIKKLKPDLIHSIEMQHAGYLALEARKLLSNRFPPWIVTNWGSDIYLFGRLPGHCDKIREILAACDFYSCECNRDVALAREMGFAGKVLPVFPNTGGFDLELTERLKQPGKPADRRIIMLKGYQHWAGRALFGLRALERCAGQLSGYEVVLYSVSKDVEIAAILFEQSTGIRVRLLPPGTSHDEILSWHGRARFSVGLSISDAISTSMLEAMVMGSLPIQSYTACADEWIRDGETGLLVPPEDVEIIEQAIRTGLTDDNLVDRAAAMNRKTAAERLDHRQLKQKTVEFYNNVYLKQVR